MHYIEQLKNIKFLNYSFLNNTILDYLIFLVIFLALFLFIKLIRNILVRRLKKIQFEKDTLISLLVDFILSVRSSFYLYLAFYVSIHLLSIPAFLTKLFSAIFLIWVVFKLMMGLQLVVDFILSKKVLKDTDPGTKVAVKNISFIIKGILWVFAGLLILSNLGVEVTSLLAGLGIGGIAVAFAFQNILEDLFSSFAIYFDKPFTVGDFITVDDKVGTVEKIGIKTTRIRALQGEEIVISNRELTNARIHNFKKLEKRRITFNFGIVYSTPSTKIKKIPDIIEKIINHEEMAEFDRAHFTTFGDSSLDFEVVYYLLSADFAIFRDIHQKILLEIKNNFEKENIEMAFPTTTVHLFQ